MTERPEIISYAQPGLPKPPARFDWSAIVLAALQLFVSLLLLYAALAPSPGHYELAQTVWYARIAWGVVSAPILAAVYAAISLLAAFGATRPINQRKRGYNAYVFGIVAFAFAMFACDRVLTGSEISYRWVTSDGPRAWEKFRVESDAYLGWLAICIIANPVLVLLAVRPLFGSSGNATTAK